MSRTSTSRPIDRTPDHLSPTVPFASVRRLHIWRGASGRRYVHGVFRLIDCPEIADATYVLVRGGSDGRREAVRIDRTKSDAPSLNLAEIRQHAAQLGANEVHVHSLAQSDTARATLVFDLRAGLFGMLAPEAVHVQPSASCAV
jgi:hypothetical protein